MTDERLREVERRYKESGSAEDGDAWAREYLRAEGLDNMMLIKHIIRMERALSNLASSWQPGSQRRALGGTIQQGLMSEVSPADLVEFIRIGIVTPQTVLVTVEAGGSWGDGTYVLNGEEPVGLFTPALRAVLIAVPQVLEALEANGVLNPNSVQRAYYDGHLQAPLNGDMRREVATWVGRRNNGNAYGYCDVHGCELPAIRENYDDRRRCGYHYDPLIHCAGEPGCTNTTTATASVREGMGWRRVPGPENVHLEICPRHSRYTGDPRLTPRCGEPGCNNPVDMSNPDCVAYNLCTDCQMAS